MKPVINLNDISKKTNEELMDLYLYYSRETEELEKITKRVMDSDPFWFFVPNDGIIDDEGKEILKKYLKEEDIPQSIDSQLDALLCKSLIRGISGGNRSSKTITDTIDGIIKSIGEIPESLKKYKEHYDPIIKRAKNKFIRGRVTAVDEKQLHRVVIETWKKWVPKKYLKHGNWEDSYSASLNILTLYRGVIPCAAVEFLTNTQEVKSSQGGDLDWAKFDEEPDKDKWKETLMRFGTADQLDISIAWTPTEGLTWATQLFHHNIEATPNASLFKLCTVCNRYVNRETIVKIMDEYQKVSSYEEMKMRLLGEAISLSGLVYGRLFHKKLHLIEPFYEFLDVEKQRDGYVCLSGWDMHLVTPMAGVFLLIDKELNAYVDRCYYKNVDTEDLKKDFQKIVKTNNYRMGWSVTDKSSDVSIKAFGGRNIYLEVARGDNAIPKLRVSQKFDGSIRAGVDEIKKRLKVDGDRPKPKLFIVNRPENKGLINAFESMERDTFSNEDKKGPRDKIVEGKHHLHASLRYIFQFPIKWEENIETEKVEIKKAPNVHEIAAMAIKEVWDEVNIAVNDNW